jgi:hypothetical protein
MLLKPIEQPQLGYYRVGSSLYSSKVQALVEATKSNQYPEWQFNNHIFDRYRWDVEPTESLETLYRRRAQQIRDRYDYVIVLYSGGADSQTVLDSFLDNGLHVDEIITVHPESLGNLYTPDATNFDPLNILSEWDFVTKPKLQDIAQRYPKTKITIYDWGKTVMTDRVQDDYILTRGNNITPFYHTRSNFYDVPGVSETLEKIDKVGLVLGIDKPRICFHENAYRLYFLDIITAQFGPQSDTAHRTRKLNTEFFYWSPESCDLLAKQAHILVKFFELSPGFKNYIQWPNKNPAHRTWYESSIKPFIYPNYDLSLFQANKMTDMTLGYDRWLFHLGREDEIRGILRENLDYLYKNIDAKFFNTVNGTATFTGFVAGMWPIKTVAEIQQS